MDSRSQHYVGEVAQKAIIEKDGKILLSRYPTDTEWDLPGGRIHTGESPSEGLKREIKEELGVDISIQKPVFTAVISAGAEKKDRYFIFFAATLEDEAQNFILEKEEVAEVTWVSKAEIEALPIFVVCKDALNAYLQAS